MRYLNGFGNIFLILVLLYKIVLLVKDFNCFNGFKNFKEKLLIFFDYFCNIKGCIVFM